MQLLAIILGLATLSAAVYGEVRPPQCSRDEVQVRDIASAALQTSLSIFEELDNENKNIVFSPASVGLALALLERGASGRTRTQLSQFLKGTNPIADASAIYQAARDQLNINDPKTSLSIANGLFVDDGFTVKPDYKSVVEQCFKGKVGAVDFGGNLERARRTINTFVSDATNAKIPELFKEGVLEARTKTVLVNALYLKAPWKYAFRASQGQFYNRGGDNAVTVPAFRGMAKCRFGEAADMQAIGVPYENDALWFYILLPKQRNALARLGDTLDSTRLQTLQASMTERDLDLTIPRFTTRTNLDLKAVLTKLGVTDMFQDSADLSRMADAPLKVSKAVHESFIRLNENGTEAASATGISTVSRSLGMPVVVDRPFYYAVVHDPTGMHLFLGKVVQIDQDQE